MDTTFLDRLAALFSVELLLRWFFKRYDLGLLSRQLNSWAASVSVNFGGRYFSLADVSSGWHEWLNLAQVS